MKFRLLGTAKPQQPKHIFMHGCRSGGLLKRHASRRRSLFSTPIPASGCNVKLNYQYKDLSRRGWLIEIDSIDSPEVAAAAIINAILNKFDAKARRLGAGVLR